MLLLEQHPPHGQTAAEALKSRLNGIRLLVSPDLTEEDLSDDVIKDPVYVGAGELTALEKLKTTQAEFDNLNAGADQNKITKTILLVQLLVAIRLISSFRQILSTSELQTTVRYEEIDWEKRIEFYQARADGIADEILEDDDADALRSGSAIFGLVEHTTYF